MLESLLYLWPNLWFNSTWYKGIYIWKGSTDLVSFPTFFLFLLCLDRFIYLFILDLQYKFVFLPKLPGDYILDNFFPMFVGENISLLLQETLDILILFWSCSIDFFNWFCILLESLSAILKSNFYLKFMNNILIIEIILNKSKLEIGIWPNLQFFIFLIIYIIFKFKNFQNFFKSK